MKYLDTVRSWLPNASESSARTKPLARRTLRVYKSRPGQTHFLTRRNACRAQVVKNTMQTPRGYQSMSTKWTREAIRNPPAMFSPASSIAVKTTEDSTGEMPSLEIVFPEYVFGGLPFRSCPFGCSNAGRISEHNPWTDGRQHDRTG